MGNLSKFNLLMWKNWVLLKRKPIQTAFEIILPVLFGLILVAIRSLITPEERSEIIYDPEPIFRPYNPIIDIAYAPNNNSKADTIMEKFDKTQVRLHRFDNFQEMEKTLTDDSTMLAGVEFVEKPENHWTLSLRFHSDDMNSTTPWYTNLLYPLLQYPGPRIDSEPNYNDRNFLWFQQQLASAILAANSGNSTIPNTWHMNRFPYPKHFFDPYYNSMMENAVSLLVMICFMYNFINTVRAITVEKERQLKESMKVMGLPGWLHWLAWFLRCIIILIIIVALLTVIFKVNFRYSAVFPASDGFLIFVFLLLFGCATVTFAFMVSVFFSRANTAAAVGGIFYFLCYLPYSLQQPQYQSLTLAQKLGSSMLANSALSYGLGLGIKFEGTEEGLQWSNLFKSVSPDDDLTFGALLGMLILDALLYLLVALYVEAVFPGDFGTPQPWYFPVTKAYWCNTQHSQDIPVDANNNPNQGRNFEEPPNDLSAGVQIKNLYKIFNTNTAVNDLNLDMYKGQITVLLGHNGAGKTTTMSMLIGMFPPSKGTAIVNGYDVRTNTQAVRDSMGICLQHNVLFDSLTVQEHLYFFGKLKGLTGKEIQKEVDYYIKLLELEDKRNSQSSTLSGGMKRKLCVGMALCGRSQVVMLDEPTAGMDPSARRAIWGVLQKQKQTRSILLTTHFMDEADLLGDRIAIMAGGKLQCCGSSFFLKKRYGAGYYLVMDVSPECRPDAVTGLLKKHIASVKVESHVGSELTYLLPENESGKFEEMLSDLENNIKNLGVESYGVSLTTLEEVFMKVGADHEEENRNGNDSEIVNVEKIGLEHLDTPRLEGWPLILNQFIAMFFKKALIAWRSWLLMVLQIALPIVFLVIAVLASRSNGQDTTFPALTLELGSYDHPITLLQTSGASNLYDQKYQENLKNGGFQVDVTDSIEDTILSLTLAEPSVVKQRYIVAADFVQNTAWYNGDPYHAMPLSLGLVLDAILQQEVNMSVTFVNKPLPLSTKVQISQLQIFDMTGFQIAINLGFGMAFAASFYIIFSIRERVSKAKHLQFVSGANMFIFWETSYLFDFLTYLVVTVGVLITCASLQEDGFSTAEDLGRVTLILIYFGFCVIPFIYLISFLFKVPSTGLARTTLIGTVTGMVGVTVIMIFQIESFNLTYLVGPLNWILLFIPFYSLSKAVLDMSTLRTTMKLCDNFGEAACWIVPDTCCDLDTNFLAMSSPGFGLNMTISFLTAFLFFGAVLLVDTGILSRISIKSFKRTPSGNPNLEPDVAEERSKVQAMRDTEMSQEHLLVLKDVTKFYKTFLAVDGVCLAVKRGECFGLLGVNGAGKTSTFKMMTGDEQISFGSAFVQGMDITKNKKKVQQLIGYCPQFDALLDDLTARETLRIFALIRGVPKAEVGPLAVNLAHEFDFYKHLDKQVKQLSGGNKRKLSTALALVGNPPLIFLDEPTTGMDPATKRYLWKALSKLRDNGKCIILTSHSMEECEALCTRLAIMVNGTFRCLGSTQRLKNKFAQGYALTIKLKKEGESVDLEAEVNAIERFVATQFPGAILQEKHKELMVYQIVDTSLPWSRIFGILENNKNQLHMEDYSIGQCSLEQVFLSFTKYQRISAEN